MSEARFWRMAFRVTFNNTLVDLTSEILMGQRSLATNRHRALRINLVALLVTSNTCSSQTGWRHL